MPFSFAGQDHLFDEGRALVEVAVANPCGPHDEPGDAGPGHACRAVGPGGEVDFLTALQLGSQWLLGDTFELDCLFSAPSNDKGAGWTGNQVGILAGRLNGVKDDFELGTGGDADQGRLRRAGWGDAGDDAVSILRHEGVQREAIHGWPSVFWD